MRRTALFIALAATLTLAGCGNGGFSDRSNAGKENVFRYPLIVNPTTYDPGKVQDGDTIDVIQQVFEGLTRWDEQNQVAPNLAESWEIDSTATVYTFKIKKGVKFHNGNELTAHAFKYSIERACDPTLQSPVAPVYLNDIVGAMDMINRKAKEVSGVKVIDDHTLQITIDQPRAYFLGKLTYPCSFAVDPKVAAMGEEITSEAKMVGTGPYKIERIAQDQIVVLTANKDYHGGEIKLEKIERPILKDAQTRLFKYRSGELDMITLQRQDVEGIKADDKLKDQLQRFERPSIYYVGMNQGVYAPFKDVRVRRAFAMAINRDRIVNEILGGVNLPADGILPKGVMGHRDVTKMIPYDPAGAKKLLAEAGYANGKGMPPLDIYFKADVPDIRMVAEAVQSDLRTNLGVQISTKPTEWGAYLAKNNAKQLPMFHMRWAADYLDPQNFLSTMLATDGPENKLNYSNPEFDRLCKQADVMTDKEERLKTYAQAEDIVLQDAPWVPIYFQVDNELISPRVKGLRESLFGHLPHTTVYLEK